LTQQDVPSDTTPIPAASLILMRDRAGAAPELLIVRRGAALVFAAGAYVFPGGRVDDEDRTAGASHFPHLDPDDAAARIAAIRETIEETGVVATGQPGDLVPFARWLPRHERLTRRFDARFYLARTGSRAEPVADGVESSHAFWATAADLLERCRQGDGRAIFPTRRLLERLARFASFAEAREDAGRWPDRIISPRVEQRAGEAWLCIPEDAGYPVTAERIATALRY
jgi:8-oxo-dGTP pyrophosphatase MutT (NUDIX family)